MKKINKLLIANRGEIAIRIIKTCKKLGIKTVSVYSDADELMPFVREADESYNIGGAIAKDSYLCGDKILQIAKLSKADAVHPGYGFLSENSTFVATLEKEGIIFVGPNSKAIGSMGDKIASKKLAKSCKVNTIPGCEDVIRDADHAKKIADEIGYPVILKASAGGGGKGIRVVYDPAEIAQSFESVTNEGTKSFGDGRIFIEKFIENPRHIEIQIIADKHGNVVCLGERECSIQRNNQKVIEESPSSFMTEKVREKMYDQSRSLAENVGYDSAGTIEYVMDKNHNFFFLEMNTRLQVEHPVTEYITGYDLVELMISSAEGHKLPMKQSDVKINGWAFESRICAEDPSKNFLPSIGRISVYMEPKLSHDVRVDSGIHAGLSVTPFYDSMIAKLITYGQTREEARHKMMDALNQFIIEGLNHNINFLQTIYSHKDFISGDFSTAFIKKNFANGFSGSADLSSDIMHIFAMASVVLNFENRDKIENLPGQFTSESKYHVMKVFNFVLFVGEKTVNVDLIAKDGTRFSIIIDGKKHDFAYSYRNKIIKITYGSDIYHVHYENHFSHFILQYNGAKYKAALRNARTAALYEICRNNVSDIRKINEFEAPITGIISSVHVVEGDVISKGMALATIEAMKMENVIYADFDTKIAKVDCKPGDAVSIGDILILFNNDA